MAIELKLSKTDNAPWGFRLTGGADFDVPHTVVKVVEGSIADVSGLKVGDVIVRIHEHSVADCTHVEVHEIISEAGQELTFGVRRDYYSRDDTEEDENNNLEVSHIMTSAIEQQLQYPEVAVTMAHCNHSTSVTDELIAEAISSEAEVLPDQNILGVNFNKIDLSQSTILTVMEAHKSEETMELKKRKWSAFLQKPERPVIRPKSTATEELKAPPYQVIIKKQKRKQFAADLKTFSPEPEQVGNEPFTETIDDQVQDIENTDNEENAEECYNEINLNKDDDGENQHEIVEDDRESLIEDESNELIEHDQIQQEEEVQLTVDEQLAQVQIQLQALAQMPSSIQDTLESVTEQLKKILNATLIRTEEEQILDSAHASRGDSFERSFQEMTEKETGFCVDEKDVSETEEEYKSNASEISDRNFQEEQTEIEETPIQEFDDEETFEPEINEEELERLRIEAEKSVQKERNITVVEESHQRRLEQRPTNPLAPIQRPIILPGGRKWAQPDDAVPVRKKKSSMSDEKIIETLDTYSETIVGHTRGLTNGTPFGHGVTT